ncbi:MAG: DUF3592 domain-containing protein [Planctomycetia bacterium]
MFFYLFVSVFYVVGFALLGYGGWQWKKSTEAGSWPTTAGTITASSIEVHSDSDGDAYKVNVEYAYRVGGVEYVGDRLAFGYVSSSGRKVHEAILKKLEEAKQVEVRYDPADPQNAVLSFGMHRSIRLILAFAIVWLLFTLGFSYLAWTASHGDAVLLKNLIVH